MVVFQALLNLASKGELSYALLKGKPSMKAIIEATEAHLSMAGLAITSTGDGYYNIDCRGKNTKWWLQRFVCQDDLTKHFYIGCKLASWDSTDTYKTKDGKEVRKGHFFFFDSPVDQEGVDKWLDHRSVQSKTVDQEKMRKLAKYREDAIRIFKFSRPQTVIRHKYLDKKKVKVPDRSRLPAKFYPLVINNKLIIPKVDNKLDVVGRMEVTTTKKYEFAPAKIAVSVAQKVDDPLGLIVVEGYATGLSIAEILPRWDVFCFGGISTIKGKLEDKDRKFTGPYSKVLILGENSGDYSKIAESHNVVFPLPEYDDFNDMCVALGNDRVIEYLSEQIGKLKFKIKKKEDTHDIQVLGYTEQDEVVVYSPYIGNIKFVNLQKLRNSPVFVYPSAKMWELYGYDHDDKTPAEGLVIKRMWNDLMTKAKKAGPYKRDFVYGSGVIEMEDGDIIVNSASGIYGYKDGVWGNRVRELCTDNTHSFTLPSTTTKINLENLKNPISPEEFKEILLRTRNFDLEERMGELFVLLLAAQNLSTLLHPRPVIYVSGIPGGGKSFLLDNVASKLVSFLTKIDSFSSCAGVQKSIGNNCETVLVDEIGKSRVTAFEIEKLFGRVIKTSYGPVDEATGGKVTVMGDTKGTKEVTRLASSFVLASVRPCITDEQELSRTVIFAMSSEKQGIRGKQWIATYPQDYKFWKQLPKDIGQRILSASVALRKTISKNKELLLDLLCERYPLLSERAVHNIAVGLQMLTLCNPKEFSEEEGEKVLDYFKGTLDMLAHRKEVEQEKAKSVFSRLEKTFVEFSSDGRRVSETFAKVCFSSYRKAVRADFGIKVREYKGHTYLWFSIHNQNLLSLISQATKEVIPSLEELKSDPLFIPPGKVPTSSLREVRKYIGGKRVAEKAVTFDVTSWKENYDEEQSLLEEEDSVIGFVPEGDSEEIIEE